jgi:DNA-binding XRE family transcriptional regulator
MQRSAVPVEGVEFTDRYGDTRVIHHNQSANGPLRVKRTSVTPALALNGVVAKRLGENVRALRVERGYTQLELAERAGLRGGKQTMWQIENALRGMGVRLGTLYVLAAALDVEVSALLPSVSEVVTVKAKVKTSVEVAA